MPHIVLDLETMSTQPNAAIVAIGAVRVSDDLQIEDEFYSPVDLRYSAGHGHICPDTVLWWMKQSEAARAEITKADPTLEEALNAFLDWLPPLDSFVVWGCGSDFDNVIIRSAVASVFDGQYPWLYSQNRCLRTLVSLMPNYEWPAHNGVEHNALHDARHQAECLIAALKELQK